MNRNGPNSYLESTVDSLNDAHTFVASVMQRKSDLVQPIITPRFAVSCDKALLIGLGDLASKFGTRIQSHLAENQAEVSYKFYLLERLFDDRIRCRLIS